MPDFHSAFKFKCSCDFSWLSSVIWLKPHFLKITCSVWKISTLSSQVLWSTFTLLGDQHMHLPLFFNYSLEFTKIPDYTTEKLSMRYFKGSPENFRRIQNKHYYLCQQKLFPSFIHSASEKRLKPFLLGFFNSGRFCCINL